MEQHHILSDQQFEKQFQDLTLSPSLFSHEAHVRLAWIHVTRYGADRASENLCHQISRFDRKFGDGTKFNKTVTVASVRAVDHFVKRSASDNFQDFIEEFPKLKNNLKELLASHYSMDVFKDRQARHQYIEPDLAPF